MLQWLPWQDAAEAAGTCAVSTWVLVRQRSPGVGRSHGRSRSEGRDRTQVSRAVATWTRELTIMFVLYALWQYAGDLSVSEGTGALRRGRDIWRLERDVHLPSEASAQRLVLGSHELVRLLDVYYAQVHVAALGLCLVWLFARHRSSYPPVRNVLVLVTAASLLIQLIPVAPPRLVPGLGLVDTGHLVGPSVYPSTVAPGLDQLSAMPSLHVGWALVVAAAVIHAQRSPWRWLVVAYPACTWFTVVVTGNHYWADGIAACALFAMAVTVVGARDRRRRRGTPPEPPTSGSQISGSEISGSRPHEGRSATAAV